MLNLVRWPWLAIVALALGTLLWPPFVAASNQDKEAMERLLDIIDPSRKWSLLDKELAVALRDNDADAAYRLILQGANVNLVVPPYLQGPVVPSVLELAAASGKGYFVKKALALGAKVNPEGRRTFTPLLLGVASGELEVVKALLDQGAEIRHENPAGLTPLQVAERTGNAEIVRVLRARGIRSTGKDEHILVLREGFQGTLLLRGRKVTIADGRRVQIGRGSNTSNCVIGHRTCPYSFGDEVVTVWAYAGLILVTY